MKTVFITGISRGIGEALAQTYLENGWQVIGIGRNSSIKMDIPLLKLDLEDPTQLEEFIFPSLESQEIHLIHNAGIIGEIARVGTPLKRDTQALFQVNVIAPLELTQKFLSTYSKELPKMIAFISSGAGRRPIPSWANYCASKAALDLYAQTLSEEQIELQANTRVFSVAPGVVDTNMQDQIRETSQDHFSSLANFRLLKTENKLVSPLDVAQKFYLNVTQNLWQEVIQRIEVKNS